MKTPKINFVGNLKKYIIGSLTVLIIGMIVFAIFGVDMDINFKGCSRFTYTYSGNIDLNEVEKVASKTLGKTATVTGVEKLRGAEVYAHDLRAGAALVIAGLAAEGVTNVEHIHFIERGYENLVKKLTALGADIHRFED